MLPGQNLEVCFTFQDQDLIAKVYVSSEDFTLESIAFDGPGERDLDELRADLDGDEPALIALEDKAREELSDFYARRADDGLGDADNRRLE